MISTGTFSQGKTIKKKRTKNSLSAFTSASFCLFGLLSISFKYFLFLCFLFTFFFFSVSSCYPLRTSPIKVVCPQSGASVPTPSGFKVKHRLQIGSFIVFFFFSFFNLADLRAYLTLLNVPTFD